MSDGPWNSLYKQRPRRKKKLYAMGLKEELRRLESCLGKPPRTEIERAISMIPRGESNLKGIRR